MSCVISRKVFERIHIGDSITITIAKLEGSRARIAVEAPREMRITRDKPLQRSECRPDDVNQKEQECDGK